MFVIDKQNLITTARIYSQECDDDLKTPALWLLDAATKAQNAKELDGIKEDLVVRFSAVGAFILDAAELIAKHNSDKEPKIPLYLYSARPKRIDTFTFTAAGNVVNFFPLEEGNFITQEKNGKFYIWCYHHESTQLQLPNKTELKDISWITPLRTGGYAAIGSRGKSIEIYFPVNKEKYEGTVYSQSNLTFTFTSITASLASKDTLVASTNNGLIVILTKEKDSNEYTSKMIEIYDASIVYAKQMTNGFIIAITSENNIMLIDRSEISCQSNFTYALPANVKDIQEYSDNDYLIHTSNGIRVSLRKSFGNVYSARQLEMTDTLTTLTLVQGNYFIGGTNNGQMYVELYKDSQHISSQYTLAESRINAIAAMPNGKIIFSTGATITVLQFPNVAERITLASTLDSKSVYEVIDKTKRVPTFSAAGEKIALYGSLAFLALCLIVPTTIALYNTPTTVKAMVGLTNMLLPGSWASLLSLIPLYTYIRTKKSLSNLENHRKEAKSRYSLYAIGTGLIVGCLLGIHHFTALNQFFMLTSGSFMTLFLEITGGIIAGDFLSRYFSKIDSHTGMFLGASAVLLFSAATFLMTGNIAILSAPFQAAAIGAISASFIAAGIAKLTAKIHYKAKYGHSNADGLNFHHSTKSKISDHDINQARLFGVHPGDITNLRMTCLLLLREMKHHHVDEMNNKSVIFDEKAKTSVKLLFNGLTQAANEGDRMRYCKLLRETEEALDRNEQPANINDKSMKEIQSNQALRKIYHCQGITTFAAGMNRLRHPQAITELKKFMSAIK